ncbi:hypothetical protein HN747_00635 [archaeon]|jgi:hypothetical protein|nr:hypothetical protein [archaeon]
MKFNELVKELKEKESYQSFMEKNPDAYVCAGFLILSKEEKEGDKLQINLFLPKKKRIATFDYPFNSFVEHEDEITEASAVDEKDLALDVDDLQAFIKEKTGIEPLKIIAIFKDGIWNLTLLNGMDMRRLKIDAYTKEVLHEDKGLLSDFIKVKKKD